MMDAAGLAVIVFNGEIYNFKELRAELTGRGAKFRSASDTEVILAAYLEWGIDCLSRFSGMFAFALYDMQRQLLYLARDRAGEKPLFYRYNEGAVRFASELKAILADPSIPRHIDRSALDCYLHMGFVPGERCILEGFNKLPPAHVLEFSLTTGAIKTWRYWQPPSFDSGADPGRVDEHALLDELESLLQDAVRRQLVADVPIGVLLSGGVDSSIITALAAKAVGGLKTYSIRFPGHGELDETEHARLIARHFGTEHTELEAQPGSVELLPGLARQLDEPMVDSSIVPTFLVSRLVRQHCTVALGGDGGDELFGGYRYYSRLLWMCDRLRPLPGVLRRAVAYSGERLLPVGFAGSNLRTWLQNLGVDLSSGLPLIASYFDGRLRRELMSGQGEWITVAESIFADRVPLDQDLLQRATRTDFANYLAEDILVKLDRASMLSSLEMRSPLLDHRVVEFAFSKVPSFFKATSQEKKILLKRLASRLLPKEFDLQRKQGFSMPLDAWLATEPFNGLFKEVLLDAGSLFNPRIARELLNGQGYGRRNGERLFALVMFELWRKEYKATL